MKTEWSNISWVSFLKRIKIIVFFSEFAKTVQLFFSVQASYIHGQLKTLKRKQQR